MSVSGVGVSGRGRLVVFDCDGVLVDSERLNVALDVEAIGELGWAITREEVIARHVGLSDPSCTGLVGRLLEDGLDVVGDRGAGCDGLSGDADGDVA
ncbi:MAG: hypothetical protein BWY91_02496 [bacterium ADurb.BinA028]|jgi:phosphoglycolate phosphatase-like HAD superfamily hydrolase|nr:MAG: hypothetical protein BWY91_02496 [bacterium ADurb.BinA028]